MYIFGLKARRGESDCVYPSARCANSGADGFEGQNAVHREQREPCELQLLAFLTTSAVPRPKGAWAELLRTALTRVLGNTPTKDAYRPLDTEQCHTGALSWYLAGFCCWLYNLSDDPFRVS